MQGRAWMFVKCSFKPRSLRLLWVIPDSPDSSLDDKQPHKRRRINNTSEQRGMGQFTWLVMLSGGPSSSKTFTSTWGHTGRRSGPSSTHPVMFSWILAVLLWNICMHRGGCFQLLPMKELCSGTRAWLMGLRRGLRTAALAVSERQSGLLACWIKHL